MRSVFPILNNQFPEAYLSGIIQANNSSAYPALLPLPLTLPFTNWLAFFDELYRSISAERLSVTFGKRYKMLLSVYYPLLQRGRGSRAPPIPVFIKAASNRIFNQLKSMYMKHKKGEGPLKQVMRTMRIVHQKLKTRTTVKCVCNYLTVKTNNHLWLK